MHVTTGSNEDQSERAGVGEQAIAGPLLAKTTTYCVVVSDVFFQVAARVMSMAHTGRIAVRYLWGRKRTGKFGGREANSRHSLR